MGSCRCCHGWGLVRADGACPGCADWLLTHRTSGRCRRFGQPARLNRDRVCRPCAVQIRLGDVDWAVAVIHATPLERPPALQLALILDGVARPIAAPLRHHDRPLVRARLPRRAGKLAPVAVRDDPTVCPPQIPGQLVLIRPAHAFTLADSQRIRDRPIPDLDRVRTAAGEVAAARRLSGPWLRMTISMARLALATRECGERLVREEDLAAIPAQRSSLAEVLDRAWLLLPRWRPPVRAPVPDPGPRRRPAASVGQCAQCLAWIDRPTPQCRPCRPCRRFAERRPVTACRRCQRPLPVGSDGRCRLCRLVLARTPPGQAPVDQLWLGEQPPPDRVRDNADPVDRRRSGNVDPPTPVCGHHLVVGQLVLFDMPRDWTRVDPTALPPLTQRAQQLLDEFDAHARAEGWPRRTRTGNRRLLRLLLAWLGAQAPIPRHEVNAAARQRSWSAGLRVSRFLDGQGLLADNGSDDGDWHERASLRLLASLPKPFVAEIAAWVRVLRGQADRSSHPTTWPTVYAYLTTVEPVLRQWAGQVDSLRAVARDHVEAAIRDHTGRSAPNVHTALRSLFRALRREQRVFTDPARGVPGRFARRIARPLPADRLAGLLDRAATDMARLAVALVAVHVLHTAELRRLRLHHIDRARGRLIVHRRGGPHVVFLDELCLTLLDRWLRERARRWPTSTNPHLLVTGQTALDPRRPPISRSGINRLFHPLGVTPQQLRTDRLLDEAQHSGDPVRLMRVFGLAKNTAIRYVATARPERTGKDPT